MLFNDQFNTKYFHLEELDVWSLVDIGVEVTLTEYCVTPSEGVELELSGPNAPDSSDVSKVEFAKNKCNY